MKALRDSAADPSNLDPKECLEICNEYASSAPCCAWAILTKGGACRYRVVLQTCSNGLYERFRRGAEVGRMPEPDDEVRGGFFLGYLLREPHQSVFMGRCRQNTQSCFKWIKCGVCVKSSLSERST